MNKLEYLIYTRRSTDDLLHQKNSLDYQLDQCRRYAAAHGLAIAKLSIEGFCEDGLIRERHTAFKTAALEIRSDGSVNYRIERPRFQQLVSLLAKRQIRGVIILCWDRLSRNPHDDAIIKDLIGQQVDIRFVQATYDPSSAGALHMDIDGMFAAHYSRVMSEKIRAANTKLRAEGKYTNRAPLGYLDHGADNKPLDPERAPLIKQLFELYATGEWSYLQLANWANQQGLTMRPERGHRTREQILDGQDNTNAAVSRPVSEKTIENLLNNPFYAGHLKHGAEVLPGRHKALITDQLFNQVQRAIKGRTTSLHHVDKEFYVYRGLVRCACGRRYSPYTKKGHAYYLSSCLAQCENSRKNMPEAQFDITVTSLLGQIEFSKDEAAELRARAPRALSHSTERRHAAQKVSEQQSLRIKRDLSYLRDNKITLLREGVYSAAQYTAEVRQLEEELARVGAANELKQSVSGQTMVETVFEFLELVKLAKEAYKYASNAEKHHLMTIAFPELTFHHGILAKVRAKEGFQALLERPVASRSRPSYVLLELESVYKSVINSMMDLKNL